MFSDIRPNRGSQKYASYFTCRVENKLFEASVLWMNDSRIHQEMKIVRNDSAVKLDRLQWLMWPSSQRIGKVIRASSYFSTRRVVDLVPEACFTAMTKDRHGELAVIDFSMIAIALTPSWLVRILEVMPGYIFHHPCFFLFCFWTRNFIYCTSASCVWFLLQ